MADASSAILFIIWLRKTGIEKRVKYGILRVRTLLCLCTHLSKNEFVDLTIALRELARLNVKYVIVIDGKAVY